MVPLLFCAMHTSEAVTNNTSRKHVCRPSLLNIQTVCSFLKKKKKKKREVINLGVFQCLFRLSKCIAYFVLTMSLHRATSE